MKKILTILFLLISLSAGATLRYIAITGNDGTGDGTQSLPWLTVAYAISQSSANDSIYVMSGTYTITAEVAVPVLISIVSSELPKPIFAATSQIQSIFYLGSSSEGTNGNQSISGLKFTGGAAVNHGIYVYARSNVLIHHCEIDNFEYNGIYLRGGTSGGMGRPVVWATGNKINNNVITNCGYDVLTGSLWEVWGAGIEMIGQSDPQIYHNDITNGIGQGGGIRCIGDSGFVKGIDVWGNNITVGLRDVSGQTSYGFAIELWNGKGGNRIHHNTCVGGIDLAGHGWDDEYGYGFAADVSDNIVTLTSQLTNTDESGLLFESGCSGGVYFRRNFVKNFTFGLMFSLRENSLVQGMDGFYVDYNVFSEINKIGGPLYGTTIAFNFVPYEAGYNATINDFRFANNVMHRESSSSQQTYGLNCTATNEGVGATWSNVVAVNNISYNVYTPLKWDNQTINTITIADNIFYNATNNTRFVTCTVTNSSVETALTDDPLLISTTNFHLQPSSPCIGAGSSIGATSDLDGNPVNSPVDIGAYRYAADVGGYYVAPWGSDVTGSGSFNSPWFSLVKAWTVIAAGDTVYVRGGRYSFGAIQTLDSKSGVSWNYIKVWAYPQEQPVLTRNRLITGGGQFPVALVRLTNSSYVNIRGVEITGFYQDLILGSICSGLSTYRAHSVILDRINSHHNGHGILVYESGNAQVLYCDTHHNYDPVDPYGSNPYGDGDGLEVSDRGYGTWSTIRGHRSWNNSDDGIDLWDSRMGVTIDGCWAWKNGYREDGVTTGGDGNGIKLGSMGSGIEKYAEHLRTITNNVSFNNRLSGINQNDTRCIIHLYNNTTFQNPTGYLYFTMGTAGNSIANNISFSNTANGTFHSYDAVTTNTFLYNGATNTAFSVASGDFASTDSTGVRNARQSDGKLPLISFLHLAEGSDLIDGGYNVGITYDGDGETWTLPYDLGAFQFSATPAPSSSGFGKYGTKFGKYGNIFVKISESP